MASTSMTSATLRERGKMMSPTKDPGKTSPSGGDAMPAFSLELLSKKREILSGEVAKLEECLRQRTQLMCKLRETLETLLTSNGNLEESARLRESKLQVLRAALAVTADAINASEAGSHALNLETGSQKLLYCEALLVSLDRARAQLEVSCMDGEEEMNRQAVSYRQALAAYQLASEQAQMTKEDLSSVALALEFELIATTEAEDKMTISSHTIEREKLSTSDTKNRLDAMKMRLDDLRNGVKNAHGMLSEDLHGLNTRKAIAEKDIRDAQDLLRKSGAALPEDFEVEEDARLLGRKLELLTVKISQAKLGKRDAVLRRKEEANILAMAKSNVASREDQLKWLDRQLNHLKREHNGLLAMRNADREAFNKFKHGFDEQMAAIAQYLASIDKENTAIVEQVAVADDSISRTRLEYDTRSALLHSQREGRDKIARDALRIRDENKRAEGEIERLMNSLAMVQSRQSELMTNANRLGMSCEDEVSEQQRCTEAAEAASSHTNSTTELCVKTENSVDEKLAIIRACGFQDASRSNVDKLIQVTAEKIHRAKEEKAAELVRNENALKTNFEKLKAHYDDILGSMQSNYADAIALKRQEHQRLSQVLCEKIAMASIAMSELSKASELSSTPEKTFVAEPDQVQTNPTAEFGKPANITTATSASIRGQRASPPRPTREDSAKSTNSTTKTAETTGKVRRERSLPPPAHEKATVKPTSRAKKTSSTVGKARRERASTSRTNHEEHSSKAQGTSPGPNESNDEASSKMKAQSPGPHAALQSQNAQSKQPRVQDLPLTVTSVPPPAPQRVATTRGGELDKAEGEFSLPCHTEAHDDLALLGSTCSTTNLRPERQKQHQPAAKARETKNTAQLPASKLPRKAVDSHPKRKLQPAATSQDALVVQSRRVEKCAHAKDPSLRHPAGHIQGVQTQATKSSQQLQASARMAVPKPTAVKPIPKSARPLAAPKMKARKASQAVDWFADDSFSFS